MRLNVLRALIATHLLGTGAALLALERSPAAQAGCADPEALSHLLVPQLGCDGSQNTSAEVE
jgi:hypothetical protein